MGLTEKTYQEAGQWIGRDYQIIRKLGSGGDGTVYLVRHVPTEQFRAAKRLKTDAPERRMRELDLMKRLRHPALPQVFDIMEDRGAVWLIMEFISGRPLSERIRSGIKAEEFFSVARQLADVLQYLHARKRPILHLDIKPPNIMLRPDGGLVLLDFGAAIRERSTGKNEPCFGTPGFAAPEQKVPGSVLDCRTDFYGYGAVLYYCLYGETPRSEAVCARRMQSDRIRWRRMTAPLIRHCLAEDRERRFPDTRALCKSVQKAERRYAVRNARRKSGLAAMFLLVVLIFSAANLRWESPSIAMTDGTAEKYEACLDEAKGLGFAQAALCYEEAAALCPGDSAWCGAFLDRIEADYSFNAQEEVSLKRLMFSSPDGSGATAEELLAGSSPEYGELAYRIGLLYWYFYEGAGGKNAAARWFERSVGAAEEEKSMAEGSAGAPKNLSEGTGGEAKASGNGSRGTDVETEASGNGSGEMGEETQTDARSWLQAAKIYLRISAYYETLGKQDIDGKKQAGIGVYWKDLSELWSLDGLRQEPIRVQCEVAGELLLILILHAHELGKEGIDVQQMNERLESIEDFTRENSAAGEFAAACREQCGAAREAVERAFDRERG